MIKTIRGAFMRGTITLALLAATVLSGCTPQNSNTVKVKLDPQNPVTIEIWHYYNNVQKVAFDEMVNEFNETVGAREGIIVEVFSQGEVNQLIQKIIDSAEQKVGAEEIPDIFAAYSDTAYQIDQLGRLTSLNKYLTEDEIAEYVPGYIEEGLDANGDLKIFPTAKSTEIFIINKTDWQLFADATGSEIEDMNTVEGLAETSRKYYEWTDSLTPEPNDGKALFGRDAMANYMIIGSRQMGVEIFEVVDGEVTINDDKEIMRRLWDNMYVPSVNGWFASYGKFRADDVRVGLLLSLIGSSSSAAYFPAEVYDNDIDSHPIEIMILPLPVFEGGEKFMVQQGAGMSVTASDPQHEYASVLFLKWFTEAERNMEFAMSSGYMPVKIQANEYENIKATVESDAFSQYPDALKKSLVVASEMMQTYTPYCNRPFHGGTEARRVLEYAMSDKIEDDIQQIEALVAQGISRADAASQFTTDENFEAWYSETHKRLMDATA